MNLEKNEESVPNDDVRVVCFFKDIDNGQKYVCLSFRIPGEEPSPQAIVPMAEVNSKNILKYLPENYVIKFYPAASNQAAYMRGIISNAQQSNSYPCYNLVNQGYHKDSDGRLLYGFGDLLIGVTGETKFRVFNPLGLKADIKLIRKTSRADLFHWVYMWSAQPEYLSALLIAALSPFIYPIFKDILPQAEALNAYLVGRTGSGKTSYGVLLTDLFQGGAFSFSLISDKGAFYKLIQHRSHIPLLIDDLNRSSSSASNYKKIEKLSEIIQMKSSAGSYAEGLSAENLMKISLIITAEESLKAPSSMNRCIVIKFEDDFDQKILSKLQENNLFPALVYRLVEWICYNYKKIFQRVVNHLMASRPQLPYESITSAGEARIGMSYKVMLITQLVLQEFLLACVDSNNCHHKKYNKITERLTSGIIGAIRHTKEASRGTDENNIVHALVDLFKYNLDDKIADTPDEYFRTRDRLIFRHEDYYYFKGGDMARYLSERFYKISNKRISCELQKEGLLCSRKGECSFPLPKKLRKRYDQDGVRFYRIYADVLDALVKDSCDNVLELFGSSLRKYQS